MRYHFVTYDIASGAVRSWGWLGSAAGVAARVAATPVNYPGCAALALPVPFDPKSQRIDLTRTPPAVVAIAGAKP